MIPAILNVLSLNRLKSGQFIFLGRHQDLYPFHGNLIFFVKTAFWRFLLVVTTLTASGQSIPTALRTDLLLHTDQVWRNGFLTELTLQSADSSQFTAQMALIRSVHPSFSWVLKDPRSNSRQIAYRLLVSSSLKTSQANVGDVWDSGKVLNSQSVSILLPADRRLDTNRVYFWKVKVWNNQNRESDFARPKAFRTASQLSANETSFYPLVKTEESPYWQRNLGPQHVLYDLKKDAFGQAIITASALTDSDTLIVHLGEAVTPDGHVNTKPGGTLRYRRIPVSLQRGKHQYAVQIVSDRRNTGPKAIPMPDYIGEVLPFRYVEVEFRNDKVQVDKLVRHTVSYPFDEQATIFTSSDTALNQIWDLCKHTIKATTFSGYYLDGDRERIPYEGDAVINQLSHYTTDAEFSIAKRSLAYLVVNPTWPTEWMLQNPLIAWNDYLYTNDLRTVEALYSDLKAKLLLPLARADGLISTRTGLQTPEFLKSIHFQPTDGKTPLRDIVDWPQQGILGLGKKEAGETDGFVFKDYNSVVNAFHYQGLVYMAELARQSGKTEDATFLTNRANQVKKAFQTTFIDPKSGLVRDGEGTDHSSLHANMMALAFGLVPPANQPSVVAHIRTRGMACSVYGAQFLLDGLYNANESAYALALLTSTQERSWYNMIRVGSTMTTEAWDMRYKPNQDWNHAWGAAPANIIVRKLMGVEPLTPGFQTLQIKPQPDTLKRASLQLATIRGFITVAFDNTPVRFWMKTILPANSTGIVYLPRRKAKSQIRHNGKLVKATAEGNFWKITNVGAGTHQWEVR